MKKVYLLFASLLLMFVLVGCDGEGSFTVPTDITLPTGELTTDELTTEAPTTIDGTTQNPTTSGGTTTEAGTTTEVPTTEPGTTTEVPTTEAPTTDDTEPVVLLDRPSNLSIDGQVLSWDEVPDAVGYKVYVDGNLQTEVTSTSYDFSSIVENYMVFNVRSVAFAEESNSDLSLDIVYNVNAASEILAMTTFMDMNMNMSDNQAFATELVSRGMTVTEMQTMMLNMQPVMTKMQNQATMSEIYPDLHTFINGMDHPEALVSAFVRVEMPNMIQAEIDSMIALETSCDFGTEETSGNSELLSECYVLLDYSGDIEYLNRLLLFIENNPDEVIQSVMMVFDYALRIENAITTQWVSDVDTLMGSIETGPFNVNLAVSVKNGLIMNFKNEMPSLSDFTIFNQTMMSFASVMLDDNRMESFIQAENTAMQMKLSLELIFDVILQVDADYINTLKTAMDSEDELTVIILQFDFINEFLDNHVDQINELDSVYTAEEKEAIFFDLIIASILEMEGFNETEQTEVMTIIKNNIDFDNLLAMKSTTYDLFNDLLDQLDETEYALISSLIELSRIPSGAYMADDDSGTDYNFNIGTYLQAGQYVVTVRGFSDLDFGNYDIYIYADYGDGMLLLSTVSDTLVSGGMNEYIFTLADDAYVNVYTEGDVDTYGELSNYNDINLTHQEAIFDVLNALFDTVNPMIQDMTEAEYSVYISNVTAMIQTMIDVNVYLENMPMEVEQLQAIEQVLDMITETTPHQFILIQNFMSQMNSNDYFTELELAIENADMSDLIILHLDLMNDFIDASQIELDALDQIYTDEEKETIFFDVFINAIIESQALTETEKADIMAIIESNIDFTNLLALQSLSHDTVNDLLDQLALTQYELVYAFVDLIEVESTYYDDWNQYDLDMTEATFDVINALLNTLNPLVQDATEAEYQVIITNITSVIKTVIYIQDYQSSMPMTQEELQNIEQVFDILDNTTPYQFAVLQTLVNQMFVNDYFTELKLSFDNQDKAQMIIIQLELLNDFLDASALEFDAIGEIYTDVEKEDIFFDLMISNILKMQGLTETEYADIMAIIETNIDFTNLLALQSLSSETINDLLDQLALTQYELVYAFVDLMEVENTYYDDWNQYDLDRAEAMAYLLDAFVNTMNPLVQNATEAEYTLLIDNALGFFRTYFYIEEYYMPMTTEEIAAVELVLNTIADTTPEQFAILQVAINQIDLSDMIMDIYDIYYNNPGLTTSEQQDYGMLIVFANVYVDTYNLAEIDIDALIADALLLLDNATIQAELNITPTDVVNIKTLITAYPENLYNEAFDVIAYDYMNLTATQIQELQELIYWIETPYADQQIPA